MSGVTKRKSVVQSVEVVEKENKRSKGNIQSINHSDDEVETPVIKSKSSSKVSTASSNLAAISRHCYNDVLQKNYEWWMNYDVNETKEIDSINNPYGNITKSRIMRENSNWNIKDMQFLNRHLITLDGQDHSTCTKNDFIYKVNKNNGWWFNEQNLIVGEKYTFYHTQKPYISFLCNPTTLKYLKNVCDKDDLVQCILSTVENERINLTKIIY